MIRRDLFGMIRKDFEEIKNLNFFEKNRKFKWNYINHTLFKNNIYEDFSKQLKYSIQSEEEKIITLRGISGSGKTNLICRICHEFKMENWIVLPFFVGNIKTDTQIELIMKEILWYLSLFNGEEEVEDIADMSWEMVVNKIIDIDLDLNKNMKILIVIDSFELLTMSESNRKYLNFFPERLSSRFKLLLSYDKELLIIRKYQEFIIPEFSLKDEKIVLDNLLHYYNKELSNKIKHHFFENKSSSPLLINLKLMRLLMMDKLDYKNIYASSDSDALFEYQLNLIKNMGNNLECVIDSIISELKNKVEVGEEDDYVQSVLEYIAISKHGLRRNDIENLMLDKGYERNRLALDHLFYYINDFFIVDGIGRVDFGYVTVKNKVGNLPCGQIQKIKIELQQYFEHIDLEDEVKLIDYPYYCLDMEEDIYFLTYVLNLYGEHYENIKEEVKQKALENVAIAVVDNIKSYCSIIMKLFSDEKKNIREQCFINTQYTFIEQYLIPKVSNKTDMSDLLKELLDIVVHNLFKHITVIKLEKNPIKISFVKMWHSYVQVLVDTKDVDKYKITEKEIHNQIDILKNEMFYEQKEENARCIIELYFLLGKLCHAFHTSEKEIESKDNYEAVLYYMDIYNKQGLLKESCDYMKNLYYNVVRLLPSGSDIPTIQFNKKSELQMRENSQIEQDEKVAMCIKLKTIAFQEVQQKRFDNALIYLSKAEHIIVQIVNKTYEVRYIESLIYDDKGQVYLKMGRDKEGLQYFIKSCSLAESLLKEVSNEKNRRELALAYWNCAEVVEKYDVLKSISYMLKAFELFKHDLNREDCIEYSNCCMELVRLYSLIHQYEQSYQYCTYATQAVDECYITMINAVLGKYKEKIYIASYEKFFYFILNIFLEKAKIAKVIGEYKVALLIYEKLVKYIDEYFSIFEIDVEKIAKLKQVVTKHKNKLCGENLE